MFFAANIALSLLAGSFFYIIFVPESYLSVFFSRIVSFFLPLCITAPLVLPKLIRNYCGDIIWAYALTFSIYSLLGHTAHRIQKTLLIVLSFELAIEILQLLSFFHCTFDFFDFIFEAIISFIAILIIKKYEEISL